MGKDNKAIDRTTKTWTPEVPICPRHQLIHTQTHADALKGIKISFKPSFDKGPINMRFIMNNEYSRMWFTERAKFEKERYDKAIRIKNETMSIKRRFVQKMMTQKCQNKYAVLENKIKLRFHNLTPSERRELSFEKMRYKPNSECIKTITDLNKNKKSDEAFQGDYYTRNTSKGMKEPRK